ncbi:MAG TPA: triple tyrosine motif-containing protein, partial [Chitinophagaceae bacterium]
GDLYFGLQKGLTWFRPGKIEVRQNSPVIRMVAILVNELPADTIASGYIRSLVLSHDRNNLFFRFRGINYRQPDKVQFAYRLDGWHKNWVYSKHLNEVRYSNLPPGKYSFLVKAANGSGEWSKDIYTVRVIIKPPFWKTFWFRAVIMISLLAGVIWLTRYISQNRLRERIVELEKQKVLEEERKRISREMHDDIGAGLTRITLMSEMARMESGKNDISEIADASRLLIENMNEIIWSIDPDYWSLDHLFSYLREQLNKLLEHSGIDYSISLPEDGCRIRVSNEQKRNILMVVKEIVHNAVKHSRASAISVNGWLEGGVLYFRITDDGKGFLVNEAKTGNGLKNIRHRLSRHDGSLSVVSEPGKGVTSSFSIPLNSHQKP